MKLLVIVPCVMLATFMLDCWEPIYGRRAEKNEVFVVACQGEAPDTFDASHEIFLGDGSITVYKDREHRRWGDNRRGDLLVMYIGNCRLTKHWRIYREDTYHRPSPPR